MSLGAADRNSQEQSSPLSRHTKIFILPDY
jgi:hypothetical protein